MCHHPYRASNLSRGVCVHVCECVSVCRCPNIGEPCTIWGQCGLNELLHPYSFIFKTCLHIYVCVYEGVHVCVSIPGSSRALHGSVPWEEVSLGLLQPKYYCMYYNDNLDYCLPHKCIIVVQHLVFRTSIEKLSAALKGKSALKQNLHMLLLQWPSLDMRTKSLQATDSPDSLWLRGKSLSFPIHNERETNFLVTVLNTKYQPFMLSIANMKEVPPWPQLNKNCTFYLFSLKNILSMCF